MYKAFLKPQIGIAKWVFPRLLTSSTTGEPQIGLQRKQRVGEDTLTMRRRLQYQMRKRGILETDLLLSTFASEHLSQLSHDEMQELDSLLSNIDWDIFYWATGKTQPPKEIADMVVFRKLQEHASKRGNSIVRMPDLSSNQTNN
ncbi:Succinate dehydrogenase assembly factor 2 mitochondrial [Coemansia brasiliensis]|uniref:Succinate dehydrogenase assembly factor 2, mitochondrial n=1 Tax=Coemansia brasiliensis TaxID=2650707 RepID=A0A9W8I520_9FUNG|nr:Succinate dehydrogenase assembly factor 2 mitochondrial [Coemansia brasiliensis]